MVQDLFFNLKDKYLVNGARILCSRAFEFLGNVIRESSPEGKILYSAMLSHDFFSQVLKTVTSCSAFCEVRPFGTTEAVCA